MKAHVFRHQGFCSDRPVPDLTEPEQAMGQKLQSVSALVLDVPDEDGPAIYTAICFHFNSGAITAYALTDNSELSIGTTELALPDDPVPDGCYSLADISQHKTFGALIGRCLRNFWTLTNDAGFRDGFMLAFSHNHAVCLVAMNNVVSILDVSGEQCS